MAFYHFWGLRIAYRFAPTTFIETNLNDFLAWIQHCIVIKFYDCIRIQNPIYFGWDNKNLLELSTTKTMKNDKNAQKDSKLIGGLNLFVVRLRLNKMPSLLCHVLIKTEMLNTRRVLSANCQSIIITLERFVTETTFA